ncbi:MAG: FliH/SctL family protein, partial [Gemmatales bacterium]|nr:FliH/SctL family protein [Gemmatales bacterium]MDW8222295.1 FliH/SctL family protein [Gemmatales bacterium]
PLAVWEAEVRFRQRPHRVRLETAPPAAVPPARPGESASEEAVATARQEAALRQWQHAVQALLQHMQHQVHTLRQALPRLAAELALFLVQETLGPGIPVPAEVWQRRLEELTASLPVGEPVTLIVSSADWPWWHSDQAASLRAAVQGWKILADPQLQPGEYRAEWGELVLWWRWRERLAALSQAVLSRIDEHAVE